MSEFLIVTDNTADLPNSFLIENNIRQIYLSYSIDGDVYTKDKEMNSAEFYDKMRKGSMPTTSQANPEMVKEILSDAIKECKDILCISFSSGLSGTYNNTRLGASEIMEEHDDVNICVIDSLSASMGEGLMVYIAVMLRKKGYSLSECEEYIRSHIQNFVHLFTVDNLFHLYRGGRVSRTAAVLGTLASVKPILHVDEEGHLIPVDKVRGRKKSLHTLVAKMEKQIGSYSGQNEMIMISHGDCLEDARYVEKLVKEKYPKCDVMINTIGPTIGTHSGPGTVALFFMGDIR